MNITTSNQPRKSHFYTAALPIAGATAVAGTGVRLIEQKHKIMHNLFEEHKSGQVEDFCETYKAMTRSKTRLLHVIPKLTLMAIGTGTIIGAGVDALINHHNKKKADQNIEKFQIEETPNDISIEEDTEE